ncbi:MAG TPA: hypothetical protein VGK19_19560 [Capsulimonadaceae bacterium]|jgi:hypothetical protein
MNTPTAIVVIFQVVCIACLAIKPLRLPWLIYTLALANFLVFAAVKGKYIAVHSEFVAFVSFVLMIWMPPAAGIERTLRAKAKK